MSVIGEWPPAFELIEISDSEVALDQLSGGESAASQRRALLVFCSAGISSASNSALVLPEVIK